MTQDPLFIELDADIDSAIRLMNRSHIRRLPVTDNGKLVGMLSSSDVSRAMQEQFDQFIGLEESYTSH